MDPLREDLCRLARRLASWDVRLFLVGGYGLLLKAEYIRANDLRTVAPLAFPRATDDLDVLLTARIVTDSGLMGAVRDTLRSLDYEPVAGREFYQWSRPADEENGSPGVRVDLLGQIPEDQSGMKIGERRMRPYQFEGLHANPVEEAAFVHERSTAVDVCPDGSPGTVELPHPFNYLLLKLYAFDDRKEDPHVDYGRHHAFDLYRIVAMLTPKEWEEIPESRSRHADTEVVRRARRMVRELFEDRDQLGAVRLREHIRSGELDDSNYPVDEFLGDLQELLLA